VCADTKSFVHNYVKHVVLLMVMEHAANKLFKKVPTPKHYKTHKKNNNLQTPHIHTPTHY